jgi:hypothetical protein
MLNTAGIDRDVRAGIQQARAGEAGLTVLTLEILAVAALAGAYNASLGAGIVAFLVALAMAALLSINATVSNIAAVLIGVGWGMLAWGFGPWPAAFVAIVGAGANIWGLQCVRDLQRARG